MKTTFQLAALAAACVVGGCDRGDQHYTRSDNKDTAPTTEARKEAKEGLNAPKPFVAENKDSLPPLPPNMEKNTAPTQLTEDLNSSVLGENREQFIAATDQKLKGLDDGITRMSERIESLQSDTEAKNKLNALREKRDEVKARFEGLKKASQEDFLMARVSFESAFDEFNRSYEEMRPNYDH